VGTARARSGGELYHLSRLLDPAEPIIFSPSLLCSHSLLRFGLVLKLDLKSGPWSFPLSALAAPLPPPPPF